MPRKASASRTEEEVKIDGRLNEEAWQKAERITDFQINKNGDSSPDLTIARILYDDKNLYVGVWGLEPNPEEMRAGAAGPIPFVFGDDSYQLYFDTNRDRQTYFRFMSNREGVTLCSGPKGLNTYSFDVVNYVGKDYWSAEFRFPLEELGVDAINEGDTWGFNMRRSRYQSDWPHSDWSKMQYFPYEPQRFGHLTFK